MATEILEKMTTRALFLDFDGVLHPNSSTRFFHLQLPVAQCIAQGRMFRYLPILHDILREHRDVRIFVHSTWRKHTGDAKLRALLGPFVSDWFAGSTPRDLSRYESIQFVIDYHKLTDYRILDDWSSEFPAGLPELVLCDSESGLYDEPVREQLRLWLEGGGRFDVV